jgi:chromosome segregation ATPase
MSPTEYQELVVFLGRRFDAIGHEFVAVRQSISEFRAEVAERFREVYGHFDEVYRRIERLDQEYYAITQSLRRIEAILDSEQGRRIALERDLADLRQRVAGLEDRVDQIQRRLSS